MTLLTATDFTGAAPPPSLAPPLKALWWLKKGGLVTGPAWDRAHEICQSREGDRDHDLVHALVHSIEGDDANANYWYRRSRSSRAGSISDEWFRIVSQLENVPSN